MGEEKGRYITGFIDCSKNKVRKREKIKDLIVEKRRANGKSSLLKE